MKKQMKEFLDRFDEPVRTDYEEIYKSSIEAFETIWDKSMFDFNFQDLGKVMFASTDEDGKVDGILVNLLMEAKHWAEKSIN